MVLSFRRHATEPENRFDMPSDVRAYAIGDIHGRADALVSLLQVIVDDAVTRDDDRKPLLIFLGDYIDRGDNTAQVIELLRNLARGSEDTVIALKGNHEETLLEFLQDPIAGKDWLAYGGRQTLASYAVKTAPTASDPDRLYELRAALQAAMGDDVGFLESLRSHFELGRILFTHAGCNPDAGLGDVRSMVWGHERGQTDVPLPGRLVVHGHYETETPVRRPGRISIDTGAYYSGRLTAIRLDEHIGFLSS